VHDVVSTEDRCRPCQHWYAALCDLPTSFTSAVPASAFHIVGQVYSLVDFTHNFWFKSACPAAAQVLRDALPCLAPAVPDGFRVD